MKKTFLIDAFGVKVENSNGKETIDYLLSKGFTNPNGYRGTDVSGYYGIIGNEIAVDYKSKFSKHYTLQELKQLDMEEQEIEGYRLIKKDFLNAVKEITDYRNFKYVELEEYGTWAVHNNPNPTSCYTHLKKAGVLDLWFEPVYKTKYKVGDWIITEDYSKEYDGKPLRITKIFSGANDTVYYNFHLHENHNFSTIKIKRFATKEEIEKDSEQVISMNGKFNLTIKDKRVFHKSEDITQFVKELVEHYEKTKFGKYSVRLGEISFESTGCQCGQITYIGNWKKVYDLIK